MEFVKMKLARRYLRLGQLSILEKCTDSGVYRATYSLVRNEESELIHLQCYYVTISETLDGVPLSTNVIPTSQAEISLRNRFLSDESNRQVHAVLRELRTSLSVFTGFGVILSVGGATWPVIDVKQNREA